MPQDEDAFEANVERWAKSLGETHAMETKTRDGVVVGLLVSGPDGMGGIDIASARIGTDGRPTSFDDQFYITANQSKRHDGFPAMALLAAALSGRVPGHPEPGFEDVASASDVAWAFLGLVPREAPYRHLPGVWPVTPGREGLARQARLAVEAHYRRDCDAFLAMLGPRALACLAAVLDKGTGALCGFVSMGNDAWASLDAAGDAPSLGGVLVAYPGHADVCIAAWRKAPGMLAGGAVPPLEHLAAAAWPAQVVTSAAARAATMFEVATGPVGGRWPRCDADALHRGTHPADVRSDATRRLLLLSELPACWIPRDGAEWAAFADVAAVAEVARHGIMTNVDLAGFLNAKGRWAETRGRLERAAGGVGPVVDACRDVGDFAKALAEQVLAPALMASTRSPARGDFPPRIHHASRSTAQDLLFGGRTLAGVLERSARWHADQGRIAAAVASVPGGRANSFRWEAGLPPDTRDGVEVVPLTTAGELADEGRSGTNADGTDGLWHCVGNYASACVRGDSRILSLRLAGSDGASARLSTAEVSMAPGDGLRVVQHRGLRNGPPSARCEAALAGYLDAVRDGTLPSTPVPKCSDTGFAGGYDWSAQGAFESVRDAWAPHLPHRCHAWSADAFAVIMRPHLGFTHRAGLALRRILVHAWRPAPRPRTAA